MKRLLQITALLAAGGALLCAVTWGTVVWTPGEGVATSEADITDFFSGEESSTKRFQRALDHLGHEAPRAFDLNGNTVYFSVNHVDKRPVEVLADYQDEFVYQDLNEHSYNSSEYLGSQQTRTDMLTGGVVPIEIGAHYVAMGGGVTENRADDDEGLAQLAADFGAGRVDKKFRGYRHIEAFREPESRWTTVVATWSDETFDYRKMIAGSRTAGQGADPRVPACPGCTRLQRFEDLDAERGHVDHVFKGSSDPDSTLNFYDRVLVERGWSHSESTVVLERARKLQLPLPDAGLRHFERGSQTLTLVVYAGEDGGSVAHLTLSDS